MILFLVHIHNFSTMSREEGIVQRARQRSIRSVPDKMDLSSVSTHDLVDELHRRLGSSKKEGGPPAAETAGNVHPETSQRGRFCRYVTGLTTFVDGLTAVFYQEPCDHIIIENSAWNKAVARRKGLDDRWIQKFVVEGTQVTAFIIE